MQIPPIRAALKLLPTCASTGIGSFPHTQQELALQQALQMDIPFLPQLPTETPLELMIPAALEGFPGAVFDADGLSIITLDVWSQQAEAHLQKIEAALKSGDLSNYLPTSLACRCWQPFLWEIENRKMAFAKIQLAGPATVRWVSKTSEGNAVSSNGKLDQHVFRFLLAKSLAMVKALKKTGGVTPIFFLDEPGLYAFNRKDPTHLVVAQELKVLVQTLQLEGALVGVHCCSNTDWSTLLTMGLDILSMDVRLSLDALLEHRDAFLQFLASGAVLSLGVVPTDLKSSYKVDDLVASIEASLRATLPESLPFGPVLSQMMVTPACGLAMRTVKDAERIFSELKDAQRQLKALVSADVR